MEKKKVRYLSVSEYAKYRQITRQTLYRWLREKKDLPMVEIAGKKVFKVTD